MSRQYAYSFARTADERLEEMTNSEFFERKNPHKKVIEEVYPLSRLALWFQKDGQEVEVEAFEDSLPRDGHIWVTGRGGLDSFDFDVEIVVAGYSESEGLRDKALAKYGTVPLAGPIRREGGEYISEMQAEDLYSIEPYKQLAASILERYEAKSSKAYPKETALLITFSRLLLPVWSIESEPYITGKYTNFELLLRLIDEAGGIQKGRFRNVFLFNFESDELQEVA